MLLIDGGDAGAGAATTPARDAGPAAINSSRRRVMASRRPRGRPPIPAAPRPRDGGTSVGTRRDDGPGRPGRGIGDAEHVFDVVGRVAACSAALIRPMRSFGSPPRPPQPRWRLHPLGRRRSLQRRTAQGTAQALPAVRRPSPTRRGGPAVRSGPPPRAPGPPSPRGTPSSARGPAKHTPPEAARTPRDPRAGEAPGRAEECRETPGKGVVWASPRLPGLLNTATPPSRRRRPLPAPAPGTSRAHARDSCAGGGEVCLSACMSVSWVVFSSL